MPSFCTLFLWNVRKPYYFSKPSWIKSRNFFYLKLLYLDSFTKRRGGGEETKFYCHVCVHSKLYREHKHQSSEFIASCVKKSIKAVICILGYFIAPWKESYQLVILISNIIKAGSPRAAASPGLLLQWVPMIAAVISEQLQQQLEKHSWK